jgi:NAD(P)H-flavin reductase
MKAMNNIYRPYLMTVTEVRDETPDVRTLKLEFKDAGAARDFKFQAGQFGEYSIFGQGECVFTLANSPTSNGYVECSFKLMGKVTWALRQAEAGDTVGFRGPYGNYFPLEQMRGRNLLFVGGGIGMAPLRGIIDYTLDNQADFAAITILNGARTVADIVYKQEMKRWGAVPGVQTVRAVDPGGETPDWDGEIGLIPHVLERMKPSPDNTVVITCGPPIMIKFTLEALDRLGFAREQILTTLENKMKCGMGKCGRCNIGKQYVCLEGPVFTAAQLAALPKEY